MPEPRVLPEGVRSQFLGPLHEWILSHDDADFDAINDPFWEIVGALILTEDGAYDDLPDWMTEAAADELAEHDPE